MNTTALGSPTERRTAARGAVALQWSEAQRDAWRLEGFKMQIAHEARQRRDAARRRVAVLLGLAIGVFGSGLWLAFEAAPLLAASAS
ncbi:MAG: hypothetical protein WDM79_15575 [Terricaulis sp.]